MARCQHCGQPVEFRFIDGRSTPLHLGGGCARTAGRADDARITRSRESECRKTSCPYCRNAVYFIRHNGGSVWIEPPLGPPWEIHSCMARSSPGQGRVGEASSSFEISAALRSQLGDHGNLITAVATKSEISKDRQQTILSLAVGEAEELVLLIKGGADSFVGRISIVDCLKRTIHRTDDERLALTILETLCVPKVFVNARWSLPPPLPAPQVEKLRKDMAPTPYDGLSGKQARTLRRFRADGLKVSWTPDQLMVLISLLRGREQDEVIHYAAVMIMENAQRSGSPSFATVLARQISPARSDRLVAWFREFSPITFATRKGARRAHIRKAKDGTQRPYQLARARYRPFYKFE